MATASAEEQGIDVKSAVPALLKVLTYDVNFDARGVGEFVILVAGEPDKEKAERRRGLMKELETLNVKIKARSVRFVAAELRDEAALQGEVDKTHASAVLAMPGTSPAGVTTISEVSQDNQIYALALEVAMVEQALPLGVTMNGTRPQIVINEKASKGVGARFETTVLKLARVIQ
ncbi:MAG: hypothetical protein JNK82_19245 [Myxococcaceae bacterium]|nr:hypothetical protein [Myxococcaceae bacterium]